MAERQQVSPAHHFWHRLPARLGLAGVAEDETARARRWAVRLEVLVGLATLWLPVVWYAEAKGLVDGKGLHSMDLAVWLVFATELGLLSALVRDRRRYWRSNWLSLLLVLSGPPLLVFHQSLPVALLRLLRLLLLAAVLFRMARNSLRLLARHALAATLVVAVFMVGTIGTLVAAIEPKYTSVWDGLWWAVVTISTVGYGDLAPATPVGRLLGVLLIVFGVLTFSMVMANVAAALVGLQVERSSAEIEREETRHEKHLMARLDALGTRLDRLEALLQAQAQARPPEPSHAPAPATGGPGAPGAPGPPP